MPSPILKTKPEIHLSSLSILLVSKRAKNSIYLILNSFPSSVLNHEIKK